MNKIESDKQNDLTRSQLETKVVFKPEYNAVRTAAHIHEDVKKGGIELVDMCTHLADESDKVQKGDLSRLEAMLTAQAHTLDVLFNNMVQRAAKNMAEGYLHATDVYMRMALKAQSQCRTTIEAIAEVKFPKSPTFIRQQNVAHQQQVNNGVSTPVGEATPHTQEKNITPTNKLLSEVTHEALDTRGTSAAGGFNPNLAAVESIHRAKD
jgi:hypothetical protein